MPKAAASTATAKRACDQYVCKCNYRRIKCDRTPQCDRCTLSKLSCTYDKSAKPRGGKRIKELQELRGQPEELSSSADWDHSSTATGGTSGDRQQEPLTYEASYNQHPNGNTLNSYNIPQVVEATSITAGGHHFSPSTNHLSSNSHEGSSSTFQAMPTFSESPISAGPYLHSSNLTNFDTETTQYSINNVDVPHTHAPSDLGSASTGIESQAGFFPSSIPSAPFSADSFLTGLYDNIQPQPAKSTDFSFLESWPFWLAGTAANSPESANPSGNVASAARDNAVPIHQTQTHHPASAQITETDWLGDSHLIPAIASFFERLHPIMPIFTRSWILDRIDKDEHRSQSSLAAMLLALSSLAKIQPVKAADRISRSQRNEQARALLEESVKTRASALTGQTHSLDEVLASFYSFATLFGMQEHDAATFRLREAVTLAQLMKLNVHESYIFLDNAEQERRLRTYWILCVTERAYALQRGDSIGLRGHPLSDMAFVVAGLPNNAVSDFPQRQLRLFDNVDEAFVDCWHGRCSRANCSTFTRDRARLLHASFGAIFPEQVDASASSGKKISLWQREMIQSIDTTITSHWLQSRLWQICLTHGLLSSTSQDLIFRPAFVLQCAYQAYQFHVAADASSREAHGVGLVEKLFDIAMALLQARGLSSIDDALRSNIDAILSLYVADLNNSSEEGKTFSERLKAAWQAVALAAR